LTTKKETTPKKAKEPPAYDFDFRSRFGRNVSPNVASVFRCKECGGYIYPLRRFIWSCETMLCGPVIPDHVIRERIIAVTGPDDRGIAADVMRLVRDYKPE